MWRIAKQFEFCYGHRVHNQTLKGEYSIDTACVCRHLHGHQGTIIIYLEGEVLQDGMITDFKHLNWFKKWLDQTLDHKFVMDVSDPLLPYELPHICEEGRLKEAATNYFAYGYRTIKEEEYRDFIPALREKYEGMVLVDFVPTSENLSKWIYDIVSGFMKKIDVRVSQVQFYETPKSQSNYYA